MARVPGQPCLFKGSPVLLFLVPSVPSVLF